MSIEKKIQLLTAVTANGPSDVHKWYSKGPGTFQITGPWDGATVLIQSRIDSTLRWTAPAISTFTEDTIIPFEAGNAEIRAVVSGVGSNTVLNCAIVPQSVAGD